MINIDLIKTKAEKGNTISQYNYGKCLYHGIKIKKDKKLGLEFLRKASDKKYLKATFELGLIEFVDYKTRDEGYEKILKCADKGLLEAQIQVGNIFNFGNGRAGTWDDAVKYYKMASEQGDIVSDYCLAVCFYDTRWEERIDSGNEKDDNGFDLVRTGFKTEGNVEEYLLKSAKAGFSKAQSQLGLSYLRGNDVMEQNIEEGLKWLKIASNNNEPEAQFLLAKVYLEGELIDLDIEKGISLLKESSKNGFEEAKKMLKELSK